MSGATDCTEALLARIAKGDAAAVKELLDNYHQWIVDSVKASLRRDKRLDSRENAESLAWEVEEELRQALLRYAREDRPTLAKATFTGLAARIVNNTIARLTRELEQERKRLVQDAEEQAGPALIAPWIEQRINDYVDTLQGKEKAIAHAILVRNFTAAQIAEQCGMSAGMARRYRRDVKNALKQFLDSANERPGLPQAANPAIASCSFREARPDDLVVPPGPPSVLGLVPGTELMPGVQLLKLIGGGTTGETWKVAVHGMLLAIKVVPNAGKEVWCEVELLSEDDRYHPHLVRGWAPGSLDGRVLFFMELADENMYAELDRIRAAGGRGYTPAPLLEDLTGVAAALDSLVQRRDQTRLVHGSVQPSNLLRFGSIVKLGGYGEVRYFREQSDAQGVPLDCPYAAPEALAGWPSMRSDQYSLALTYYELRGGQRPRRGGELERDCSVLHRGERAVIDRALSPDPCERYESCQQLLNDLRRAVNEPSLKNINDKRAQQVPAGELLRWKNLRRTLPLPAAVAMHFIAFERRGNQAAGWFDDQGTLRQEACPRPLSHAHYQATVKGQRTRPG